MKLTILLPSLFILGCATSFTESVNAKRYIGKKMVAVGVSSVCVLGAALYGYSLMNFGNLKNEKDDKLLDNISDQLIIPEWTIASTDFRDKVEKLKEGIKSAESAVYIFQNVFACDFFDGFNRNGPFKKQKELTDSLLNGELVSAANYGNELVRDSLAILEHVRGYQVNIDTCQPKVRLGKDVVAALFSDIYNTFKAVTTSTVAAYKTLQAATNTKTFVKQIKFSHSTYNESYYQQIVENFQCNVKVPAKAAKVAKRILKCVITIGHASKMASDAMESSDEPLAKQWINVAIKNASEVLNLSSRLHSSLVKSYFAELENPQRDVLDADFWKFYEEINNLAQFMYPCACGAYVRCFGVSRFIFN